MKSGSQTAYIMNIFVSYEYLGIPLEMEEHFAVKHHKQKNRDVNKKW